MNLTKMLVLHRVLVEIFWLFALVHNLNLNAFELNAPPFLCSEYEMLIVNTKQCVSRCPIACLRGICYENGTCPCAGQYLGSCNTGLICAADCLPGCKEAGGFCAAPDLCLCRKGYVFDELSRHCGKRKHRLLDACGGRCMYGKCSFNGECICAKGYKLQETATLFGQLCEPICETGCGPNAICLMPNMCACRKKHHHYARDGKCHKDF